MGHYNGPYHMMIWSILYGKSQLSKPNKSSDLNPISEKENEEKLQRDEIQKEAERENEVQEVQEPSVKAEAKLPVEKENEETQEEPPKVDTGTTSPTEPVPQTQLVVAVSPSKPVRKSRPQGKLVSAMINAFSNRQTLPKNQPEEIDEKVPEPVNIIPPSTVLQTQIKPEIEPEVVPEPVAELEVPVNLPTGNTGPIMTSLPVDSIEKSKSSSFSVPKPSAQFRSVKRPVIRTKAMKASSMEKPKSTEGPAMTYADIMAAKEGRVSTPASAPSNPLAPPSVPNSVPAGLQDANQNSEVETEVETYGGNENTSDDAESIPISYQEPQDSFKKSSRLSSGPDLQVKKPDLPDSEESSISEVHQDELKKDLTNHSHIPSRSRKPLVKRPSISLDQIPEEKSEASVSEKKIVEKDTSKKKRRRRSRDARDGASMRSTSSMEERLASDEKLRREFEEFVKKQKELEKEQKREKKKRKKEKKKTEEVKVTNIFDGMEQNFDVQTTSNSSEMTPVQKRRLDRMSTFSVKLIKRVAMDGNGNMSPMRAIRGLAGGLTGAVSSSSSIKSKCTGWVSFLFEPALVRHLGVRINEHPLQS